MVDGRLRGWLGRSLRHWSASSLRSPDGKAMRESQMVCAWVLGLCVGGEVEREGVLRVRGVVTADYLSVIVIVMSRVTLDSKQSWAAIGSIATSSTSCLP